MATNSPAPDRIFNIGVVGCGNISRQYLENLPAYPHLRVVACADIDRRRAEAQAAKYGVPRVLAVDELLTETAVDIVVNLTVPDAHAEVNLAAARAGKHVYSEKPLTISREEGQQLLAAAAAHGVRVGCAPDTFLGGGLQTCRRLLDDGAIGQPVAATAFFASHGPEGWHPNPHFFYQPGAGPLFDMGPYYLTALISLLGPLRRVTGSARISFPERPITSQPLHGQMIPVNTPTHVAGVVDFTAGPVATLITSFDVWAASLPRIEIYGSDGTLSVPDPNIFGGTVRLRRAGESDWRDVPLSHRADVGRGIGVADMAAAIGEDRPHRANGAMAYHVLDTMHALLEASQTGRHITLASNCERPLPLPANGQLGR